MDIVGTLGEISGFWIVVPLMFGLWFYRPETDNEHVVDMRSFTVCKTRGNHGQQAREDFSGRVSRRNGAVLHGTTQTKQLSAPEKVELPADKGQELGRDPTNAV